MATGTEDPVAVAAVIAIHAGDLAALRRLLAENPWLATARFGDDCPEGMSRTLLHVVTDWPGHFPDGAATVAALAAAGAEQSRSAGGAPPTSDTSSRPGPASPRPARRPAAH